MRENVCVYATKKYKYMYIYMYNVHVHMHVFDNYVGYCMNLCLHILHCHGRSSLFLEHNQLLSFGH